MLPPLPPIARPDPTPVDFTAPDYPINPDMSDGFRVMLARFPGNNQEHPDSSGYYMKILPSLLRDQRIGGIVPFREPGTPITKNRNLCVRMAIEQNCDYVLMVDNDMSPDCEPGAPEFWPTAWSFMMNRRDRESARDFNNKEWDIPAAPFDVWWRDFAPCAIAAPYCGAPPDEVVCVLNATETNGSDHPDHSFRLRTMDRHDAARRSGIGRVDAIGTGLILIDVRCFFYVPPPWFSYEYSDAYESRITSTEDVVLTRNMSLLGMGVYAAWDCWAGHHKLKKVQKPSPIPMELVRGSLRQAFEKQFSVMKKLHFVHPDSPRARASE